MQYKKDNQREAIKTQTVWMVVDLFKQRIRMLIEEYAQYRQLRINAENEYEAMSCGAFNPRLLAKIRRCKANNRKKKNEKITTKNNHK